MQHDTVATQQLFVKGNKAKNYLEHHHSSEAEEPEADLVMWQSESSEDFYYAVLV